MCAALLFHVHTCIASPRTGPGSLLIGSWHRGCEWTHGDEMTYAPMHRVTVYPWPRMRLKTIWMNIADGLFFHFPPGCLTLRKRYQKVHGWDVFFFSFHLKPFFLGPCCAVVLNNSEWLLPCSFSISGLPELLSILMKS